MLRAACSVLAVALCGLGADDGRQASALVEPTQQIPRDSYKTWSLFLVCTPDWVATGKAAELRNLYWRFQAFGDAIGGDNLAVWFWKQRMDVDDVRLSENVDVARSAEYCRVLALAPSKGPYLVVTNTYPELNPAPRDRAVYTLGGLSQADLAALLNTLTDQLLLEGKVDSARASLPQPASAPAAAPTSNLWLRLLEAARRSMIGVRCSVGLQISTGVLSAELRACAE